LASKPPEIPNIAELMASVKSGKIFSDIAKMITESQIWTSSFRHGYADTPRNRVLQIASNVWLHLDCRHRGCVDVLLPSGGRVCIF
jgi:hypothetical protein